MLKKSIRDYIDRKVIYRLIYYKYHHICANFDKSLWAKIQNTNL
jgi:hypothetical protein